MRFEIFLAWRYLRSPRRDLLTRLTAAAAVTGIAAGVAAMIFAQTLAAGFRLALQNKILQNTRHVTVFRQDNAEIGDWQDLGEKIKTVAGVRSVSATSFDNVLLIGKTNSAFAALRGNEEVQSPKSKVQSPSSMLELPTTKDKGQRTKVEIGRVLAEKSGLRVGDRAEIIAGGGELNEELTPISTMIEVAGIFETGVYEYDSTWIKLSLAEAASAAGKQSPTATVLAVETGDIYQSKETAGRIGAALGADYKVLDWQEANRPLFAALAFERRVAVSIIAILIFIAALNITTTLALVVSERRSDVAVLKTCGARRRSVVLIFLIEGALLGAVGISAGLILAWAACLAGNRFGFFNLPSEVYEISQISLEPNLIDVLATIAGVFVLSLAATAIPAWRAAKARPVDNLKN